MPHYLYCRHRFPRGARCRLGSSAFLKLLSDAAHPHSPSRVAVPLDAPRGPRGARPGAATGGGASAGGGARAHRIDRCATRSASNTCRIPPPRRRAGEASAVARSRPNASGPGNGASTTHPARRGARHRAHTRGGVCLARCRRPERTEPRRVDRPASPRSARETKQTKQTQQTRDGFDERSARVRGRIVPCRSVRAASEARRAERRASDTARDTRVKRTRARETRVG